MRRPLATAENLEEWLVAAWKTNNRITTYLIENLPDSLWKLRVPGSPRRTVRMIGAHLHNSRCTWLKLMGGKRGAAVPKSVDRRTVSRGQLAAALNRSGRFILRVLRDALRRGGRVPAAAWQNYPTDVAHFLAYHIAHEAHHRGQIVMLARQLGHRLPASVTSGLWQLTQRAREVES